MLNIDISKFPATHQAKLKDILYDLAEAHKRHKDAHTDMIISHSLELPRKEKSKKIDDATFRTLEIYQLQLDHTNRYCKYLEDHDLIKYIDNG